MTLKVIIVNYNGAQFIRACLDSVIQQFQFYPHFNILVVDNASSDDSLDVLDEYSDHITLIKNKENVGFGNAHNQLLDELDTPYIWLLNNDTEFDRTIDIISPIISYLDAHPLAVGLSPKLLNTDGTLQAQGSLASSLSYRSKQTKQVSFLSGAALFIRTDFFKKINGFDPHLYFYNDDVDFAMQVKKHSKQLIYFPSVAVTHHGGLSTTFKPVKTKVAGYFGSLYLCKKYYSYWIFLVYFAIIKLLIMTKNTYYSIVNTSVSEEWKSELNALTKKINHDL